MSDPKNPTPSLDVHNLDVHNMDVHNSETILDTGAAASGDAEPTLASGAAADSTTGRDLGSIGPYRLVKKLGEGGMGLSHSSAKPSITVYRPAWALASRVTLISNRFTATLASTPSSPTPKSMPQQPPSSSKRERDGNFDRSHSERTRAVLLRLSVTLLGTLNLLR